MTTVTALRYWAALLRDREEFTIYDVPTISFTLSIFFLVVIDVERRRKTCFATRDGLKVGGLGTDPNDCTRSPCGL